VRFVPEAVSYHRFAGSLSAGHPLRAYYLGRNQLWMVGRHAPLWNAVPLLLAGAVYRSLVKAPLLALRAQPELGAAETRAALHGLAAGAGEIVRRLRHGSSPVVPDPGR
jgi:hypothetical protein